MPQPLPAPARTVARALYETAAQTVAKRVASAEDPASNWWDALSPEERHAADQVAEQTIERLDAVGLLIYPLPLADSLHGLEPEAFEWHLEALAHMTHLRWVNEMMAAGWEYGAGFAEAGRKIDPLLLPWDLLHGEDRLRVTEAVQALPAVLARANLGLARDPRLQVHDSAEEPATAAEAASPLVPAGLARAIHEAYVVRRMSEGQHVADNFALRPWEHLDPALVRSNHEAARQLCKRLRAFGYVVVALPYPRHSVGVEALEPILTRLAESGHLRWVNERIANGWQWAIGPKNIEEKTSPFLVPYFQLPPEERAKNMEQIEDLFPALAAAGLKVVRLGA